jgi:pyridoxine 5-phosphate synthase
VAAGAHGITAHLREDRRHIQDRDVWELREKVQTRLNLEMANAPEIVAIALEVRPAIVCIVPERRLEVTTEGGLDVVGAEKSLTETRIKMNDAGIEVSLFIAPDEKQIEAAARTGCQFVELHTGQFAEEFAKSEVRNPKSEHELQRLIAGAKQAHALGLKVNAGHGLNYENLPTLFRVPHLVELNIGHSIVSRAVIAGMETAVKEMLRVMENYRGETVH